MTVEQYRNLVIGSGEAGKYLAWNLAKMGQKTAVVERSMIGGSCPNIACLPSKNVIYSAKAVSLVDPDTGLKVTTGPTKVDMGGVARCKRDMVDGLIELHLANFKASGAELVMGDVLHGAENGASDLERRRLAPVPRRSRVPLHRIAPESPTCRDSWPLSQ